MQQQWLICWILWVQTHSRALISGLSILMITAAYYSVTHFAINTDTRDMLSADLSWRQLDIAYEKLFPEHKDSLLLVVEADTPDQAQAAAADLYQALRAQPEHYQQLSYLAGADYFKRAALLFYAPDRLRELTIRLTMQQTLIKSLAQDHSLRGFFNMLADIIDRQEQALAPLHKAVAHGIDAAVDSTTYTLSWQDLLQDKQPSRQVHREFILLHPHLDYQALYPAQQTVDRLRLLTAQLGMNNPGKATLRLGGEVMLAHEELMNVSEGNVLALLCAFIIVSLILIIGLRSLPLIIASLISLTAGLIFTTAFALLTVGSLNLISVAFAVLYIGLGIDFAIHFCLHYQTANDPEHIPETAASIGHALILCALTTAIGFYAFTMTAYDGLAELGWISGSGMLISLLLSLSLLPALLHEFPVHIRPRQQIRIHILQLPIKYATRICIVAAILMLGLLYLLPKVEFDPNTLHLQAADNESVKLYKDLLATSDDSPWQAVVVADGRTQAQQLIDKLTALPTVAKVTWLEDFMPTQQAEKLPIIAKMRTVFSPQSLKQKQYTAPLKEQLLAIQKLTQITATHDHPLHPPLARLWATLQSMTPAAQAELVDTLEKNLLAYLPDFLQALDDGLAATKVTLSDLPTALTKRWYNEGKFLLRIAPADNIYTNSALRTFVAEVKQHLATVTGPPVVIIAAGDAVVSAFKHAFMYAFLAIAIILYLLLPRMADMLRIMLCLLMGILLTAGASLLFAIPFNFANVIALPLLLGIGVDSGIHIVHQYRHHGNLDYLLHTPAARGVLISGLTSICGIGNLMFSGHPGTASMGALLALGITVVLLCNLLLLPALLAWRTNSERNEHP